MSRHGRAALALLVLLLLAGRAWGDDAEVDDSNPHHMAGPDDDSSCSFCHEEDMSLTQSPLDTCLVCHSATEHAGSVEHLRVKPAQLPTPQPTPGAEAAHLPLTDAGEMWCGTCHLFHDPQVNEEALLSESWLPPTTGLSGAVRAAVAGRWEKLAETYDQKLPVASFATSGTAWLRLPVSNGALCLECHRGLKK